MMFPKIHILLILAIILAGSSCSSNIGKADFGLRGNGNIVEVKRNISRFSKLIINCDADIIIEQNSSMPVLEISLDKNLIKYLTTSASNGILEISFDEKVWHSRLKIKMNNADFSEIRKNGKGVLESINNLKMNKVYIYSNGKGSIDLNINCDSLVLFNEGKDEINLKGNCNNFVVNSNSNTDIDAKDFIAHNGLINILSSGDCKLSVVNLLKINIQSSGDVANYIKAARIEPIISGSGEFIQR